MATIKGTNLADTINGTNLADLILGEVGNDLLRGLDGNDEIHGGAGIDTVTFGGATFVDVDLVRGSALSSLGQSSLSGIENVYTTSGNDFVLGNAGANKIMGFAGNDQIDGGEGNDRLIGGSGADTFVFQAVDLQHFGTPGYDSGHDVISDFGAGDRIDLSGHFEATTFAALKAGASQLGTDTVLRLGEDTIRIEDVSLKSLSAEMFLF